MIFHMGGVLPESVTFAGQFGWMGVDLFFVLSGYLIGGQLLKPYLYGSKPSLLQFYRRRAFRILPAYLFVLTLYFIVPVWRERPGISPPWHFLTFTENFLIDYSIHQAFSHAWSLCVEEHFYLVLPLLVLWLMRKPSLRQTLALLAAFVVFGIAIRGFIQLHTLRHLDPDNAALPYLERIYYPTYTRLDGLLAGVTLALVKTFRPAAWSSLARRGHSTLLAGVVLIGISVWLFQDRGGVTGVAAWSNVIGFPVLSLGFGLLVASSVSKNGWLSRVSIPGTRTLAVLAFSLYLTHKAVVHLDQLYLSSLTAQRDMKAIVVYAASTIAVAGMLYLCVERPFMMLRDWLDNHETGKAADVAAHELLNEPAL